MNTGYVMTDRFIGGGNLVNLEETTASTRQTFLHVTQWTLNLGHTDVKAEIYDS